MSTGEWSWGRRVLSELYGVRREMGHVFVVGRGTRHRCDARHGFREAFEGEDG